MDISECVVSSNGEREYRTLFRYNITKNELIDGRYIIEGYFEQPNIMSEHLKKRLMQFGAPQEMLQDFLKTENETVFK